MEVLPPPSCSALVTVVFDEIKRGQLLEVVVEIVSVDAQRFLQLNSAHFIGLRQFNVGASTRWMGQCSGDGVAAHSSHWLTVWQEGLLWFEDVVSRRIKFAQFLAGMYRALKVENASFVSSTMVLSVCFNSLNDCPFCASRAPLRICLLYTSDAADE